ncbi:helix-turn-helix domain-containing protein [Micromonospora sp. NBC_01796]|uniref:helix-turn-helix domain-containing protein n=1 Tax=Micromonospora sp. NBC_01796 TaxID=2975987 RepID=UPI002DD7A769|nr:helix-turn-helix transcriptional regulator [Micromonospora sp. NBC_01796]WSA82985.1 helix-turn-helix transcriptional regulator [Micromonospora sp. NBC_01796]
MTTDTPTMDLIRFQLRRLRTTAGMNQEEFGKKINFSASSISAAEVGTRPPDVPLLKRVDEVLQTGGLLVQLLKIALREGEPTWFRPWREAEQEAKLFRTFQPNLVPGLLQTEAYARAVILSGRPLKAEEVDRRVTARLERQSILTREEPAQLIAVLDEATLHRRVGDRKAMVEQLDHLVALTELPHIDIHVVPYEVGVHVGLNGPFLLAGFDDGSWVAYLDNQLRGQVFSHTNDIATLQETWERIRGEALPHRQSVNLIKEVAQTWS